MPDLEPIQWLQLADAVAWLIAVCIFIPSALAVWRGSEDMADRMALPIILVGINQMWRAAAWLWFPEGAFEPNQLPLRFAIHAFSILAAIFVSKIHLQAQPK